MEEKPEQLEDIFAAGKEQTAAIEATHEYLLRSRPQTAAINGFFSLILFPIYCCVYTKTTANDKQQIRFFPLVHEQQALLEYITYPGPSTISLNFWLSWFLDMVSEPM